MRKSRARGRRRGRGRRTTVWAKSLHTFAIFTLTNLFDADANFDFAWNILKIEYQKMPKIPLNAKQMLLKQLLIECIQLYE